MKSPKKNHTVCCLFLVPLLAISSRAEDPEDQSILKGDPGKIGILPEDRVGSNVSDSETNPFALPVQKKQNVTQKRQLSQEDLIRERFSTLKVTGVAQDANGRKTVLIDDMILRENELVKPVILEQKEQLIVKEITDEVIEFVFVEPQTRNRKPRTLKLAINLTPQVMGLLPGHTESPDKPMDILPQHTIANIEN